MIEYLCMYSTSLQSSQNGEVVVGGWFVVVVNSKRRDIWRVRRKMMTLLLILGPT
ncbi:hypothetical protein HanOQP8_Chr11g0393661 [Helianthus annuus]|nr:hypothetical protein HanOQP8_Chr11g0393661 [Helianthus annuus]